MEEREKREAEEKEQYINEMIEKILRGNMDYFEEADFFEEILFKCGMTQYEFAKKIGRSQGYISNKMRLLKLSEKVKNKIKENNLSERHARAIVIMGNEEDQLRAIDEVVENAYSAIETEYLAEGDREKLEFFRGSKNAEERQKRFYRKKIELREKMFSVEENDLVCEAGTDYGDDGEDVSRIVFSSDEAKKATLANINNIKDFIKKLKVLTKKMEESGLVVKVNFENSKERISYTISFPKKDNMLWK